jgi:hypothetical protein
MTEGSGKDRDAPAPTAAKPTVRFGSRRGETSPRLFRSADAREAALIGLSALVVKSRPVEGWAAIADRFEWFERGRRSGRFRRFKARAIAFFGPSVDDAFVIELWHGFRAAHHRRRLEVVAEKLLPDYRPEIDFNGRERLDEALSRGKGVILWLDNFRHHSVIGKRPFADAGYTSWQLSLVTHGFSRSRFGSRWLNPLQQSVEARYVAGRIELDRATTVAATREVRAKLAGNGIVRITNNAAVGRQFVEVPIGASAFIQVATGPFNLVRKSGATLLPVAVVEHVAFRRYSVTVGAPIPLANGDRESAFREAALLYVRYLEPLVRAHPEQWMGWIGPIDTPRFRPGAAEVKD